MAFLGFVIICISASLSSISSDTVTGTRPINSGISPNLVKSPGSTILKSSSIDFEFFSTTSELNPMLPFESLFSTIFSSPSKAPPQINNIFVVSICISSCCGCFLPPCGGTEAMLPSSILSSACCTPSPDTSLVMDTFSDFFVILSISSI